MIKDIEGLSPRQCDTARAIYAHLLAEGQPPSVRWLCAALGVHIAAVGGSKGTGFMGILRRKGWLEFDASPGGPRWNGLEPRKGAPVSAAYRLKGVSWAWLEDGTGAVRRVPFCDLATPEGRRLARVLAGAKAVAA